MFDHLQIRIVRRLHLERYYGLGLIGDALKEAHVQEACILYFAKVAHGLARFQIENFMNILNCLA